MCTARTVYDPQLYKNHATITQITMKHIATTCLLLLALVYVGCSSSKDAAQEAAPNPYHGAWVMDGSANGALQLMSSGDAVLEQGDILAAINRHQNTDRAKYRTRLVKEATYKLDSPEQLTLNVMADWTGKGTGSRRAEDKSVASTIVFSVIHMGDTMKLTKVSMTQSGSGTDNTNADEELVLTLNKM